MGKLRDILTATALTVGLAGSPNADAQVNSTKEETNKNLLEVAAQGDQSLGKNNTAIPFEYANFLQDQQLFEKFLNDKDIQELINKYGEEEVKQVINEIITNKYTGKIFTEVLKDEEIQKALEEGNKEKSIKRVEEIVKTIYNTCDINNTEDGWGSVIVLVVWLMLCFHLSNLAIKKKI